MKIKILEILLIVIVILIILFAIAIAVLSKIEDKNEFGGLKEITGTMQSFEISHGNHNLKPINIRTTERYDDKFLEYLDSIQESRDETFLR